MKKLIQLFASLMLLATVVAQQKPIRLIVRGDDMGYTHCGNEALMKAYNCNKQ